MGDSRFADLSTEALIEKLSAWRPPTIDCSGGRRVAAKQCEPSTADRSPRKRQRQEPMPAKQSGVVLSAKEQRWLEWYEQGLREKQLSGFATKWEGRALMATLLVPWLELAAAPWAGDWLPMAVLVQVFLGPFALGGVSSLCEQRRDRKAARLRGRIRDRWHLAGEVNQRAWGQYAGLRQEMGAAMEL